jgi:hypothetical protein
VIEDKFIFVEVWPKVEFHTQMHVAIIPPESFLVGMRSGDVTCMNGKLIGRP